MAGKNNERRTRIKAGIRKKLSGTSDRPRLSVFRSNKGIYAQIIDDLKGVTLASASTTELGDKTTLNIESSKSVGKKLAEKAAAAGVQTIVFDRNGYLYHGNIKAFAEGAREGGLKF
ncbi:MAG TPA: 50S ribosomal protein L18 [Cyclobacteriaceae bacterium]|nr:50S ribosomal protein L18 [Cyclobacteriaceae bacterium]HMV09684.1 50S ribosomal protein L18 [Cyclobacteriaceae bacterium]HMV89411.1 50S ribosomal protein L18 [Cyclobacteriaceae bacterium]HMX02237.1 50S ribosomal protein L18 [Cyclobacteriaceae bacterium]HMX51222.1 50S ribosomal protein L18 [Cyclobacteriaceae bacterium]